MGHAIENRSGYGGTYIHGEAISVGMVYAARLSVAVCGMALEEAERIEEVIGVGIAGACIGVEVGFFTRSNGCR